MMLTMTAVLVGLLALHGPVETQQDKGTLVPISRQDSKTATHFDPSLWPFYHGVASGDPLMDRVIIWTRVTGENDAPVSGTWKVARDTGLTQVVRQGAFSTDATADHTVKIDVTGLEPGTTYYYAFEALGRTSTIGRTKTAPSGNVDHLKFAIVSCSNYQGGYFNAYARVADRSDLDAVIHLGDYIYEYEQGGYGYDDQIGRGHAPENEIVTLSDYRVRYSFYHLDPDLQRAHQQHPFIPIWDDHEFANDAFKDGAENHQPATEGDWETRKQNAFKAYFEWMPIRETATPNRIYRQLQFGNLMDLMMLDTRIDGREKDLEMEKMGFLNSLESVKNLSAMKSGDITSADLRKFVDEFIQQAIEVQGGVYKKNDETAKLLDLLSAQLWQNFEVKTRGKAPAKKALFGPEQWTALKDQLSQDSKTKASLSILGREQFDWLIDHLGHSSARWKVLGNQVMMMPIVGFTNKDAWDGYKDEREQILRYILDNNINNVVVLTGDIHSAISADVPQSLWKYTWTRATVAAVEFVTPSITSSNLDEFVGVPPWIVEGILDLMNPHAKGVDLANHGYYVLDVTPNRVQADWYWVDSVKVRTNGESYGMGYYVDYNGVRLKEAGGPVSFNAKAAAPAPAFLPKLDGKLTLPQTRTEVIGIYGFAAAGEGNMLLAVPATGSITVRLVDEQGQTAESLYQGKVGKGLFNISFNLPGDFHQKSYFVEVQTETGVLKRRLVLR